MEANVKRCKCGKKIIFIKTSHGKIIPVDFKPWINPKFMVFDHKTMTAHFATCANAREFRKSKGEKNQ